MTTAQQIDLTAQEVRDNFGMTAAERYGAGNAYAFVVRCDGRDKLLPQSDYYASRDHAEADAAWLNANEGSAGRRYSVERVLTAQCGLIYRSRVPEFEAARRAERDARDRAARVSRLVKRGVSYGDALRLVAKPHLARGEAA